MPGESNRNWLTKFPLTHPGFRRYELNIEDPGYGAEPERKGSDENHQGDEGEEADTVNLVWFE